MIQTDNLVREMLSILGYTAQSLERGTSPDKLGKYLKSEQVRLVGVIEEREDAFAITEREIVY